MTNQLSNLSEEIRALVGRFGPSVVAVHGRRGHGSSGVHWRPNLIVTAEHTLRIDEDILVTDSSGEKVQAKLVGRDPGTEIAVLKADKLSGAPVGVKSGHRSQVGDWAFIIGRSPNSGVNASAGLISAVSAQWRTWRGGELDAYIRLGAEIFTDSTGGLVIDYEGQVVGIATTALSRVAGLAIPSSTIDRVVDVLLKEGTVPRPYLGVGLQSVPIPPAFHQKLGLQNPSGLMVLNIDAGSSAEKAGLLIGDILIQMSGKNVEDISDLQSHLRSETIGTSLQATIIRGGKLEKISLTVGKRSGKEAS